MTQVLGPKTTIGRMSSARRGRLMQVGGGYWTEEMKRHLHILDGFVRADEILHWLIVNRKTGKDFIFFVKENDGSILKVGAEILRRINREKKVRPVIAGKDYLG